MAEATAKRGLYMAYNKTTADDAKLRFSANVTCRTAHSLAYTALGRKYRHRLDAPRLPAHETARLLGITGNPRVGTRTITMFHQARLVMGMVRDQSGARRDIPRSASAASVRGRSSPVDVRVAFGPGRDDQLPGASSQPDTVVPVRPRIGKAARADAVPCRGNAGVMTEVLAFLRAGIPVAIPGGGDQLRERHRRASGHPDPGRNGRQRYRNRNS